MNDELIVLHEICKKLTNNKKDSTKLYNDYLYLTRNGKKYFSEKSIFIDGKFKTVKTVKESEFYKWVVAKKDNKKFATVNISYIPKKYTLTWVTANLTARILFLPEDLERGYTDLYKENARLKAEIAELKIKADKYDSRYKNKGKKAN